MNSDNVAGLFTVSQIARALGCSRQNVHQQLAGITPDGERFVSGNLAKAWKLESLPTAIVRPLCVKADAKGYRTTAALLANPFLRYEPRIPLSEVEPRAIEKARKLQAALRHILLTRNDPTLSANELAQRGVEAYKRATGHAISESHWTALFKRTIDRDNGAEEWDRLEIYLEENPPRSSSCRVSVSAARERSFEILEDALMSLTGLAALTGEQRRLLWIRTCDELQFQVEARANLKRTKRALVAVLLKTGLLGASAGAITKTLARKFASYIANGHKLPIDGRSTRFAHVASCKAIPDDDFRKLVARTLDCGGRVSQAWRELHREGELSAETCERFISNPRCKSRVPAIVRTLVGPEVKRLLPFHHGPREHQLRGAYNTRDYSSMFAGDSYQADDVTCPVYYWEADPGHGLRVMRGQLILMIDERSRLALGFALHSESNYNARIIRALVTRVHDAFGLPRRRFYFERGIWRSSKILTGAGDELTLDHTELGLREFGVKFVHAKLPRGKVIERVLGLHQNVMERLPGYVGRDEISDRFERVQEQKRLCDNGREHPNKFFLNKSQWEAELSRICEAYNAERQEGMLRGLSPIEAWDQFQSPEPQVHLGKKTRYLLAHHKLTLKVQRSGIVLRPSLGGGTYCNETTGRFVGERMMVWVNPEDLTSIALTSVDRKTGPFVVPRLEPLPALDPSREEFTRNASQIDAHNGTVRTSYRLISEHLVRRNFRPVSVDDATATLGERIEVGSQQTKAQTQLARTNVRKIAARSRELGISVPLHRNVKSIDRAAEGVELIAESLRLREKEEHAE
jgi:hypothetical protein